MASQAELQAQLAATDNALVVLRRQLAAAQPGSAQQTQLSIAIYNLEQQRAAILAEIASLDVVTNPPDPAAIDPTADSAADQRVENREPDNNFVFGPDGELLPADSVAGQDQLQQDAEEATREQLVRVTRANDIGGNFIEVYDPETGLFNVENLDNGEIVATGLSEQEAILQAQERSIGDPGYGIQNEDDPTGIDTALTPTQIRNNEYIANQARANALLQQARQQAIVSAQRKDNGTQVGDGDWRVRIRLAPNANYLYKTPGVGSAGILEPLRVTDGVVFPYTPRIDMVYQADYNAYDLTHNNYRGYFYKGSKVGEIVVSAEFTAQDSNEADYLLATIHFFKSCTKMFYGQDPERGSPPPLVYMTGLGQFQFNEHPCVISQFNYNLPNDVDYIRSRAKQESSAGIANGGNNLLWRRPLQSTTASSYSLDNIWARLTGANLPSGAVYAPPAPPNLGQKNPTYVPTKITISLTLLPVMSRKQVSQQFYLKEFANGNLLRGGYW